MREINFRGKRLDDREWVEGYYLRRADQTHYIVTMQPNEYGKVEYPVIQVDPNTVGQFTGMCDRNGTKIFEGDILIDCGCFLSQNRRVFYDIHAGRFAAIRQYRSTNYLNLSDYTAEKEVIGNIHDNPELLEQ